MRSENCESQHGHGTSSVNLRVHVGERCVAHHPTLNLYTHYTARKPILMCDNASAYVARLAETSVCVNGSLRKDTPSSDLPDQTRTFD